jgi:type IV pilus assembly protein PilA
MLARLQKAQEEHEEGFTLIELLVVIIIIGILAAIAIPVFLSQRQKGYDAGIKSDLRNAATAEESYLTDNDFYYAGAGTTATAQGSGSFDETDTAMTSEGMKFSSTGDYTDGTRTINVEWVASDGTTTNAGADTGYCLDAQSASGHIFVYNSSLGGLQKTNNANCP